MSYFIHKNRITLTSDLNLVFLYVFTCIFQIYIKLYIDKMSVTTLLHSHDEYVWCDQPNAEQNESVITKTSLEYDQ